MLAGCQGLQGGGSSVDGSWASDDASPPFITTFQNGAFTTRLTTGETVVSDGRYARAANGLTLSWTSLAANEQRSAACSFVTSRQLACTPSVGQTFTMSRVS
jgi:hypothetical protein